ncbi:hypothetical protein D3C78_907500 [compost metagenome]
MPTGKRQRGKLTSLPERQHFVEWLNEAVAAGARKTAACEALGVPLCTLQRWTEEDVMRADARTTNERPVPCNALSSAEREVILAICNSPEYAHLPPCQIVPRLADKGSYQASESTFYRVLRAADQQHRRGPSQLPRTVKASTSHVATAANQVWSWGITYLPAAVRGQHFYLYLIEDIYSRRPWAGRCTSRKAANWTPACCNAA